MKHLIIQSENYKYLLKDYKDWLQILGYAKDTVYKMPQHIQELLHYLEQNNIHHINQVNTKHIQAYYKHLQKRKNERRGGGLSNASLNKHQQALKQFSKYLRRNGKGSFPIHLKWERKSKQKIKILSKEEVKELFIIAENQQEIEKKYILRDRAILVIYYSCGLRRIEGASMNVEDVLFERERILVKNGKGHKERYVPVNRTNLKILQDYIYDSRSMFINEKGKSTEKALFVSSRGRRMHSQSIVVRLKKLLSKSENQALKESEISLHSLRHSIASHLLQNGMPLESISTFLGHSSLESTQIYTHYQKEY